MSGENNVILIDDDPMFNFINTKIIENTKVGFTVEAYEDAQAALNELGNVAQSVTEFRCLIFVDINMPELNGWDFLEQFSKLPESFVNSCRIYMLSSSNDIYDIDKSKKYPAVQGFISKPLTTQKVLDIYNKARQ